MSGEIILYCDPHGEWPPLWRAFAGKRPEGLVTLGDCNLDLPIKQQFAPLLEAGIRVGWILGNKNGFVGIDETALSRVGLVVHDHHHASYEGIASNGIRVCGLAKADVFRIRPRDLA